MQIQSGKLFINRTWDFIYPCLQVYGIDLMYNLNNLEKVAVGLKDFNKTLKGNYIYILIKSQSSSINPIVKLNYKQVLAKTLEWFREQSFYVTDYVYSDIDKDSTLHMLVLKIPALYVESLKYFYKGLYSKMYTLKEIDRFFKNKPEIKRILHKDKSYINTFLEKVNKDFGTSVTKQDFLDAELEYPPFMWEEIFNYKQQ